MRWIYDEWQKEMHSGVMWEKPEIKGRNLRIERTPQEFKPIRWGNYTKISTYIGTHEISFT